MEFRRKRTPNWGRKVSSTYGEAFPRWLIDFQREVATFKIEFGNYLGRFFFRLFRDADAVKKEGLRCHQTQRNPCCRFSAARSVVLVVVGLGVVSFL